VPIEPKDFQLLLDAFEQAKEREQKVCPVPRHSLWRNLQIIRNRADLPRWKDALKVMQRNCETDGAQVYPQYVVSTWFVHGIEVSACHYLQAPGTRRLLPQNRLKLPQNQTLMSLLKDEAHVSCLVKEVLC